MLGKARIRSSNPFCGVMRPVVVIRLSSEPMFHSCRALAFPMSVSNFDASTPLGMMSIFPAGRLNCDMMCPLIHSLMVMTLVASNEPHHSILSTMTDCAVLSPPERAISVLWKVMMSGHLERCFTATPAMTVNQSCEWTTSGSPYFRPISPTFFSKKWLKSITQEWKSGAGTSTDTLWTCSEPDCSCAGEPGKSRVTMCTS